MTNVPPVVSKKSILSFWLCLSLLLAVLVPVSVFAAEPGKKTVRVGWYESPFNITDAYGGRSGYAYEYQQKIAAYTGWEYEYVKTSWPKLLEMLQQGEIDLLSDVSHTEERAKHMLYSALPMGEEEYYIFVSNHNRSVSLDNYATFDGKRVGVNKNSVQKDLYLAWAEKYGIKTELVELTGGERDSLQKLSRGNIDLYVGTIIKKGSDAGRAIPICKIGSTPFYFAVNQNRPDLLKELDAAMNRIQDENRYYNQQMYSKYFYNSDFGAYLTPSENDWLSSHGRIRVGYRTGFLPYCGTDAETGKLTGALQDYLEIASSRVKNAKLSFEPVPFDDVDTALDALRKGEIDCVFPVSYTDYDAEKAGILVTDPPMHAEMFAVIRKRHRKYSLKDIESVAHVKGHHYHENFLKKHFPRWKVVPVNHPAVRFQAVNSGEADCFLVTSYRLNSLAEDFSRYKLTTIATGVDMTLSFALQRDNHQLYSILNKVRNLVPDASVYSALAAYSHEEKKVSFKDYVGDNLAVVIAFIASFAAILLGLLLFGTKEQKKASERQKLISAAENDKVSGLFNRGFFYEYARRFRKDYPTWNMDAIVLNIEQFHIVNELNGRAFGNNVLHCLGETIQGFLKENGGIASRVEADRFDIYCRHLEDYQALLDRFQEKVNEVSSHTSIRLRMGVMPWQEGLEAGQAFDRAWSACNMVRGCNRHLMVYNEEIRARETYNQRLLNDLRQAVENREFKVFYQPKYNIQCDPPRLASAEALIRWQHPELGLVPPCDFIPLFEGNGQISVVDKYVWEEAARQIAIWKKKYGIILPVSVNLSRVDVFDPNLGEIFEGLIRDNGLTYDALKLEVTESAYTDNAEELLKVMERLRSKGFEIEMDDFGSGYSSLNMLSSMPVDILKMDRGFILNIEHNPQDFRLVQLILDIARNLKLTVIAEGVETENQMLMLKNAGCDVVQGYYFSRPVPPEEFERFIIREHDEEEIQDESPGQMRPAPLVN
ncbi:EAL domain-containing protein [uncultured Succiniclasticum sp.]|uniref:EAL domain-containing protein n=1 Tax=uncultured Succiniclasticum sp. TaxID=1500547 RepID=UPI0025D563B8|nr:EAL domain-containing protein [uncultured Succiniclasticum sp.]